MWGKNPKFLIRENLGLVNVLHGIILHGRERTRAWERNEAMSCEMGVQGKEGKRVSHCMAIQEIPLP